MSTSHENNHDAAAERDWTAVDATADAWVETLIQLDPLTGSYLGNRDSNGKLGDYSPEGIEAHRDALAHTLKTLRAQPITDRVDAITVADLGAELELGLRAHELRLPYGDLNVLAAPPQEIRDSFDLLPRDTNEDWENIARRATAVPKALTGYLASLEVAAESGTAPAARQVRAVATQLAATAAHDGGFAALARSAADSSIPDSLKRTLADSLAAAGAAYQSLADTLANDYINRARERDGVGRDVYELRSEEFLGKRIDLDEAYEWGLAELDRMVAEQTAIANAIVPGASVAEAAEHLAKSGTYTLTSTAALQEWMQATSDEALAALNGTQFSIPPQLHDLACRIAPSQEGGIYYTGPSDDFSRPGSMWWSVPAGETTFETWREKTTVYHEGVPGHHLQIGQAVVNRSQLNTWRRQLAGTSGHIEGWALYAERLMAELGYLDDPADRLGMLDGQRLRAARVALDLGVHLGKQRPDGAGVWTAEYAYEFLSGNVSMSDGFVRFELNRYLGWPGQAPSYKIGQRVWESLRHERERAAVDAFDLKAFHADALALGSLRLDTLEAAISGTGLPGESSPATS